MKQMGWREGEGLGKHRDGIKECIQIQRREELVGLGFKQQTPDQRDSDWWTQIYERGLNKKAPASGRMQFVQGKGLKTVGVLARDEEDLTSDLSEEEEQASGAGQAQRQAPRLSALELMRQKMKSEFSMFQKGETLKSEFEDNWHKKKEAEGNDIEDESEDLQNGAEELDLETDLKANSESLDNLDYVREHMMGYFDCSSEYSKKEKKIYAKFLELISKNN